MLKLYDHPLSPYAQKVRIALREKGQPFELVLPNGVGAGDAVGDFVQGNPRAEVPMLVDGDLRIFDSTIILEYIEDRWPAPPLLPATAAERARVRMIEEVMDTHYEAVNWGMGELNWFRRADGALAETLRTRAAEQTQGFFAWLERELGERPWFNGEAFGWGDLCVAPMVASSAAMGHRPVEGGRLAAWLKRAGERPSVAETLAEARSFSAPASGLAEALASGRFKREYRDHRLEWMIKSGGLEVVLKGLEADNIRFTSDFS